MEFHTNKDSYSSNKNFHHFNNLSSKFQIHIKSLYTYVFKTNQTLTVTNNSLG